MIIGTIGWPWLWWSVAGASLAWSGLDVEANWWGESWGETTPSLSPYSDWDLRSTLRFTRKPGKPWVNLPEQTLVVTAYTDRPLLWKPVRYWAAMKLAQWYLARCRIRMEIAPLRRLKPGLLTKKALVQWVLPRNLSQTKKRSETFLFFTRHVQYYWGLRLQRQLYRLLGVSSKVRMVLGSRKWITRNAVWVRLSPVYTTLVHELGHRLGLPHVVGAYRLMVTGSGVRSSATMLWTSLLGYLDPVRFRFTPQECHVMHQTLNNERKK